MPELIPNQERVLDTVKATHPRNAMFAATVTQPAWLSKPHRDRTWTPGAQLDQGREGACVGFGSAAEVLCTPVAPRFLGDPNRLGKALYDEARRRDEEQGEDYEGTTLTGGGNAMRAFRYLDNFIWLKTPGQVALAIAHSGPVVVGIPWTTGMDQLRDPGEFFSFSGTIRGWHCVLLYSAKGFAADSKWRARPFYDVRNSWGGAANGRLSADAFNQMLAQGADAWVGQGRHLQGAVSLVRELAGDTEPEAARG